MPRATKPATLPKPATAPADNPPRKSGVTRSPDIEAEILARMSTGEPLAVICRSAPDRFPHPTTWNDWCAADPELKIRHGRARDAGYDSIAQDCMSIADSNIDDVYCAADGEERTNSDVIQRAKLRVETRLKLLAKWDPRRYGDKIAVDQQISGSMDLKIIIGESVKPAAESETHDDGDYDYDTP
jgi:hypothetical protein